MTQVTQPGMTPWKQMKDVIFAITPYARNISGTSSVTVSHDGQTFTILDSISTSLEVPLNRWQEVCQVLCDSLSTHISKMIDISQCAQGYHEFGVSKISDDLSDVRIHLQPKNISEMAYIRGAMVKSLTTCSGSTLDKWFSYESSSSSQ